MKKITYIYGLKDPRDNQIYYIGKSNNPDARFSHHLVDKVNKQKTAWICDLKNNNLVPELVILKDVFFRDWQREERAAISKGFADGWPLTNILAGGNGPDGEAISQFCELMDFYLPPSLYKKYLDIPNNKQDEIGLKTAQAMAEYWALYHIKGHMFDENYISAEIEAGRNAAIRLMSENGATN